MTVNICKTLGKGPVFDHTQTSLPAQQCSSKLSRVIGLGLFWVLFVLNKKPSSPILLLRHVSSHSLYILTLHLFTYQHSSNQSEAPLQTEGLFLLSYFSKFMPTTENKIAVIGVQG